MENETMISILVLALCFIVVIVFFLIVALVVSKIRQQRAMVEKEQKEKFSGANKPVKQAEKIYTIESVFDFMNFDKIEDNMIIQKKGKFLMVVECQGINYDLMSEMEKISVEQGFITFLNTLRHPIQIYIQTRTVNLQRSIENYDLRLKDIESKYNAMKAKYEKMRSSEEYSDEEIEKVKYELVKQRNLYEYTQDIIKDTERVSHNKNVLNKKYYIIVPCYQSEMAAGDFSREEVINMAFSELYTRTRSIINSLFACQINGRILDSEELVELLYSAYNRDEYDVFGTDKAIQAGYEDLYSTAQDVFEKKIKLLDKRIEQNALNMANEKINEVISENESAAIEKEKNFDELVKELAQSILTEHENYLGSETTNKAIEKIQNDETKGKEEVENEVVQKKSRRGRPRRTDK